MSVRTSASATAVLLLVAASAVTACDDSSGSTATATADGGATFDSGRPTGPDAGAAEDAGADGATSDASADGGADAGCTPIPDLVGFWKGDTNATSEVGALNGTWSGNALYATAKVGQGFSLNGASFVEIADDNALDFTTEVTIDAWIRLETAGNTARIFDKITEGGTDGYLLDVLAGKLRFVAGSSLLSSSEDIPVGVLTHVGVTFKAGVADLFINGVNKGQNLAMGSPIPINALTARLGSASNGLYPLTGILDEVAVYSRALTAAEVVQIAGRDSAGRCR